MFCGVPVLGYLGALVAGGEASEGLGWYRGEGIREANFTFLSILGFYTRFPLEKKNEFHFVKKKKGVGEGVNQQINSLVLDSR